MESNENIEEALRAADRFGAIIEEDPPTPGEYRDVTELDDHPSTIVSGVMLRALEGLPVNAAVTCLGLLAQYHDGLGVRVYEQQAAFGRSLAENEASVQALSELDNSDGAADHEAMGLMRKVLEAGQQGLDEEKTRELRAATERQWKVYEIMLTGTLNFGAKSAAVDSKTATEDSAAAGSESSTTSSGLGCMLVLIPMLVASLPW